MSWGEATVLFCHTKLRRDLYTSKVHTQPFYSLIFAFGSSGGNMQTLGLQMLPLEVVGLGWITSGSFF